MSKPPTAEEVLGLFLDAQVKERAWEISGDNVDVQAWVEARAAFGVALARWQAAQGPVTREWFVERFGSDQYEIRRNVWLEMFVCDDNIWLITRLSSHFHNSELHNPTRSDIETLVRVLGGTQ